jgi:hypothetical protein
MKTINLQQKRIVKSNQLWLVCGQLHDVTKLAYSSKKQLAENEEVADSGIAENEMQCKL